MAYTRVIAIDVDIEDQFRAILGLTAIEFPDTDIALLPILPAAELEVMRLVPTYAQVLLNQSLKYDLTLAVLYLAADNAVPSLRLKVLELETDNKSTAQRFRRALDLAPNFRSKAMGHISNITASLGLSEAVRDLLEVSIPSIDEITGESL